MSKFVKIRTELRDLALIKRALDDLRLEWKPNVEYVHRYSGKREQAAVLVNAPGVHFGLREQDGRYEVMADDMYLRALNATLAQVTQRYAYHKVLADAALAGFELVEENVGRDQVIRLTVRRWSGGA